jgi:hypothetical protein
MDVHVTEEYASEIHRSLLGKLTSQVIFHKVESVGSDGRLAT